MANTITASLAKFAVFGATVAGAASSYTLARFYEVTDATNPPALPCLVAQLATNKDATFKASTGIGGGLSETMITVYHYMLLAVVNDNPDYPAYSPSIVTAMDNYRTALNENNLMVDFSDGIGANNTPHDVIGTVAEINLAGKTYYGLRFEHKVRIG